MATTTMTTLDKVEHILEHVKHVQENCYKLGVKLIKEGREDLGIALIRNGQKHDNSKFTGLEFKHLFEGDPLLGEAISQHNTNNEHHPERWGSIHNMPQEFIAEMVCDCAARSSEFGSGIREWFSDKATLKYGFTMDDEVGTAITCFLDMLLTPQFNPFKSKHTEN